jgi:hypothetical protein
MIKTLMIMIQEFITRGVTLFKSSIIHDVELTYDLLCELWSSIIHDVELTYDLLCELWSSILHDVS